MASIRKRGDRYYVDYRIDGKRVRKSVGTSREQAEASLKDIELKIQQGVHSSNVKQVTFEEMCALFYTQTNQLHSSSTRGRYAAILQNFQQFLDSLTPVVTYINTISPSHIDQYKIYRINKSVKNKTINSELMVLRMLFRMAMKFDHLVENPADRVSRLKEESVQPPKFLTKAECSQLLAVSDPYTYILILILLLIGLRKYELENLTWKDIDFENQQMRIESFDKQSNIEEIRTIPIHPDAFAVLQEMKSKAGDRKLVFVDRKGRRMSKNYLRDLLIKTAKKCGLTDVTQVNVLRNTFASQLVLNGVELATIKKLMGASDKQVDRIYTMLTERQATDAINALSFKSSGNPNREASE